MEKAVVEANSVQGGEGGNERRGEPRVLQGGRQRAPSPLGRAPRLAQPCTQAGEDKPLQRVSDTGATRPPHPAQHSPQQKPRAGAPSKAINHC